MCEQFLQAKGSSLTVFLYDGELVSITGTARSNKKTRTDKFGGRFTASVTLHTQ